MPIHRTRAGQEPSGGAEPGRSIVQIGDVFVEYSGAVPDPIELDTHLHPLVVEPPLTAEELYDILKAKNVIADTDRPRPKKPK